VKRRYFPDFPFFRENLIIEVKSEYTYRVNFTKNMNKAWCVLDSGYDFVIMICDKKAVIKIITGDEIQLRRDIMREIKTRGSALKHVN